MFLSSTDKFIKICCCRSWKDAEKLESNCRVQTSPKLDDLLFIKFNIHKRINFSGLRVSNEPEGSRNELTRLVSL